MISKTQVVVLKSMVKCWNKSIDTDEPKWIYRRKFLILGYKIWHNDVSVYFIACVKKLDSTLN